MCGQSYRLHVERLEQRNLLAANPVISEFLASNSELVFDGDQVDADWIEIFNQGDEPIDLEGWRLTDRRGDLGKWVFPSIQLGINEYLVVFASGQEQAYQDAVGHLHTNFRLSAGGEYLALVTPTGDVWHELGPSYPQQQTNVSYGFPIESTQRSLLESGTIQLRTESPVPADWTAADFETDATWRSLDDAGAPLSFPIGFDVGSTTPSLVATWNLDRDDSAQTDVRQAHDLDLPTDGIQLLADGPDERAALFFDGTAHGSIEWHPEFGSSDFTFTAWVRPTSRDTQTLISNDDVPSIGKTFGYRLHIDAGRWTFTTGDGTAPWHNLRGPSARLNQWNHISISYDASTRSKQMFVNGSRVVGADARFAANPSAEITIAGRNSNDDRFVGGIANVNFFDKALSNEELRRVMTEPIISSATGALNEVIQSNIASEQASSTTRWARTEFELTDRGPIDHLRLETRIDDGFIAYLNGTEIASNFAPSSPADPQIATSANPRPTEPVTFDITQYADLLADENVLAIQLFDAEIFDEDFLLDVELIAEDRTAILNQPLYFAEPTPGEVNSEGKPSLTTTRVTISNLENTFESTLNVQLVADALEPRPIYYTVDGSLPTIESNLYSEPLQLTTTTQLRARVITPNSVPGPTTSRTFLQLDQDVASFDSQLPVVIIDNLGAGAVPNSGWNQTNSGIQQVARQSASISIFEPTSVETNQLRNAAVTETRAGIRVRGAFSSSFPQPGYSVETWDDQFDSDSSTEILGMAETADWVFYAPNPQYDRTLIDNSFMFELSNQVGHWAPEVRYVEVFLNSDGDQVEMSDHIGLFAIVEKVERTEDRLDFDKFSRDGSEGGWLLEINRMDSIAEDGTPPKNFHTAGPNGNLQTPADLGTGSGRGDDIPRQYNAYINFDDPNGRQITTAQRTAIEGWLREMEDVLYGRSDVAWNDPVEGYAKYIDVENFIDYMHFNNLSHNGDGLLISMWLYNPNPSQGGKLRFGPIWDVDLGGFEGDPRAELIRRTDRLWYGRLFDDPDFEQRFADRWFELREGPVADDNLLAIIDRYRTQIGNDAAQREGVRDWIGRLSQMETWVTTRADRMGRTFVTRPIISPDSGVVEAGTLVEATVDRGTIYYTLDGTDPRAAGGAVGATAIEVTEDRPIRAAEDLQITARTLRGRRWSAPIVVNLSVTANPNNPDINFDGRVNALDVETICQAIINQDEQIDLTGDQQTDQLDLFRLLELGWDTTVGDANLDGRFDSTDLVQIFIAGRYEQEIDATYSSGDWNCDGRFDTQDLVFAFRFGTYIS